MTQSVWRRGDTMFGGVVTQKMLLWGQFVDYVVTIVTVMSWLQRVQWMRQTKI